MRSTCILRASTCTDPNQRCIGQLLLILRYLEQLDTALASGTDANVLNLDTEEVLDEAAVLLTCLGELFELGALCNVGLPAGEGLVHDFDLGKTVKVGCLLANPSYHPICIKLKLTREAVNLDTVQLVPNSHLDLFEPVQNIELGQVETGVAVDHGRVLHDDQVQPTTATTTAGSGTVLSTDLLEGVADIAEVFGREGSTAHTGGVRLDDTNDLFDHLRGETETGADTANGGSRRCDKGIRSVVNVQHERIGTFDEDPLAALERVVQECGTVDNVRAETLGKGEVHFNLAFRVKLKVTVSLETALNEFPEFGGERRVVQVVHAQTRARRLGRVGRSDTLASRADGRAAELDFLETVDDLVEPEHKVRTVRHLETARAGETFTFERVELVEQGRNVHDNTGADESGHLFVDQPYISALYRADVICK